jgi:hypothetical protein
LSVGICLQVFVGIVRFFAVAFALVVVVAETEWVPILRFWKVNNSSFNAVVLNINITEHSNVIMRKSFCECLCLV